MKNVRESRLDYMFHRQLITEFEFVADLDIGDYGSISAWR